MKRSIYVVVLVLLSWFLVSSADLALADGDADGPVVVVAHLDIIRSSVAQALPLMRGYLTTTREEHGIRNAALLLQIGSDNHFTLVETWDNRAAYDAHNASAPIREFRSRIFPFLASPYDDRLHTEVAASQP